MRNKMIPYHIMYNVIIKIIYVYTIRCSQKNMHTITFFFVFLKLIHNWLRTVNICWFNIVLLKLFSDKKRPDVEIYNALIMLRIALIHVHYIHLYMLETYIYNSVSHTINLLFI